MSITQNGHSSLYTYDSFENKPQAGKTKKHFLWWCAGAYQDLLRQYPSEHTKYAGLGGVILATFVLASLSAGYAIYSVFGDIVWTVTFALIWGFIIFNFDRFLVSTMRKYGVSPRKQLQLALPRFLLALLIGLTIARPLELKIFEKEIDVKMAENRHKKILMNDSLLRQESKTTELAALGERLRLSNRKAAIEDTLHRLQQSYVQEADGTGGSGRRGIERLTKLKMDAFNNSQQQFSPELLLLSSQLKSQDSILANLQSDYSEKQKKYEAELQTKMGFLERNKALADLSNEETSVFWANFFISLLIILIEVGPVLSKLMMPIGPYDIALAKTELTAMANSENEMSRDKELLQERLKNLYKKKKEVSDEMVERVNDLQRKHMNEKLDEWENGSWKEDSKLSPLNEVMKSIKEKADYKEENML